MRLSTKGRRDAARRLQTAIESLEPRRLLAAIASDQTLTGSLATGTSTSDFTFSAAAGDSLVAFVAESTTQNLDPRIELIAPNAASLGFDAGEVGADLLIDSLPQTGTYTLRVSDNGSDDAGNFTITMAHLPGTQSPNDSNGGAITSGPRVLGTISVGDLDVYTIAATLGDQVMLSIADTGATTFEPQMLVYIPTGGTPVAQDVGDVGADLNFTAASTGTYYVVVRDWVNDNIGNGSDGDVDTGTYALTMAKVPGTQTNPGDGGTITSGPRLSGTIDLGDIDVYTFSANSGDQVILDMADIGGTNFQPQVQVYTPTGTLIVTDFGADVADVSFQATSSGTHFIVVKDWTNDNIGGGFDGDVDAGTYAITLAKVPGAQTDDSGQGGPLASGPRVNAGIDLGDLDVYTIAGAPGQSVILNIADTGITAFEPEMRVFSPTGTLVASDVGDAGADIFFSPTVSGTYYVVVKDWVNDNIGGGFDGDAQSGTYALTMALLPGTQTDDSTDGGAFSSGQRVTGTIDPGDLDVWTMNLNAGDFILGVCRSFEAAAFDAQMLVYSPSGALLTSSTGTGVYTFGLNSVASAGTYYIVVHDVYNDNVGGGFDGDVEGGQYAMTVVKTPGSQTVDSDSGALVSGTPRAGAVSIGDMDIYTFSATSGTPFTLNLSKTSTAAFEPTFSLYNPSGTLVTTQSGASSATYTVSSPATGTYTAVVYDSAGDESGPYSIALNTATGSDNFAPHVLNSDYEYNVAPPDLRVIFTEDVGASLTISDVQIVALPSNTVVNNALLSTSYQSSDNALKISFPAENGRVLPDGNYELRLHKTDVTDANGNQLDADLNFDFFVFAGDANRDRTVDSVDFNILVTNFAKSPRLFSQGDFNYDGSVNTIDFNILVSNFSKHLAPASVPASASMAPLAISTATISATSITAAPEELALGHLADDLFGQLEIGVQSMIY